MFCRDSQNVLSLAIVAARAVDMAPGWHPHLPSFNLVTLYEASFRISSRVSAQPQSRKERDAADRSRYPVAIDQDRSTPINFAESINFSPLQKIRTQRSWQA